MKSYNGIFERAISVENIESCIYSAARGKRHKRSVVNALQDPSAVAKRLHGELERGEWRPPQCHVGRGINDGVTMKKRVIVCPEFDSEQIVHHVIVRELEKIYMRRFYRWSCGSVPGRGQEEIARRFTKMFDAKKFRWCVKLDISKCFDSINTDALIFELGKHIRDKRFLALVETVVRGNRVRRPDGSVSAAGVPIGMFTSPWFANIVMDRADHLLKDDFGMRFVVRFMDDIIIFHPNRRKLVLAVSTLAVVLSKYGLSLKRGGGVFRFAGTGSSVRFCGMSLCDGGRVKLRDRIYIRGLRCGSRIRRKIRERRRVSAYDARRLMSYAARFRAFGAYGSFVRDVLHGQIKLSAMRRKISTADRARSAQQKRSAYV